MKIENVKIEDIKTYEKIKQTKKIQKIANSIKKFGFGTPVLIDEYNELIAGHERFIAAKYLKIKKIPAVRLKEKHIRYSKIGEICVIS